MYSPLLINQFPSSGEIEFKQHFNMQSTISDRTVTSKITLETAELEDSGNYTCRAENEFGFHIDYVNIAVLSKYFFFFIVTALRLVIPHWLRQHSCT